MDAQLIDYVGSGSAPNLDRVQHLLKQMLSKIGMHMERRGYSAGDGAALDEADPDGQTVDGDAAQPGAVSPGQSLSGQIMSDQEVLKALDMIISYYERNEPSSPVPLLIKRAKRLVGKSFVDIIRDISPDALAQVNVVSGEEEAYE